MLEHGELVALELDLGAAVRCERRKRRERSEGERISEKRRKSGCAFSWGDVRSVCASDACISGVMACVAGAMACAELA